MKTMTTAQTKALETIKTAGRPVSRTELAKVRINIRTLWNLRDLGLITVVGRASGYECDYLFAVV